MHKVSRIWMKYTKWVHAHEMCEECSEEWRGGGWGMDQIKSEGGVNDFSQMMADGGMVRIEFWWEDGDSGEGRRSGLDTRLWRSGFELGVRKVGARRGNQRGVCSTALYRRSEGDEIGEGGPGPWQRDVFPCALSEQGRRPVRQSPLVSGVRRQWQMGPVSIKLKFDKV
jgi:hypothetical protein